MHEFDYRFLREGVSADVAGALHILYDLRARNRVRMHEQERVFANMREAAIIESVRGSNAIEGIVTTRSRLRQIVQESVAPVTHDEQEILGYRNALQEIYAPGSSADISEDYIRHLHVLLLGVTSLEAGSYKRQNNWIQERDDKGHVRVRFVPTSASQTPDAMEQLVLAFREVCQDSRVDSLSLVACVVVDFLCIHPFSDGNGRVSRLITTMLLLRSGFDVGRYVSIEGMIDKHKAGYYDALAASSVGWHENENGYTPFVLYLLQILYACYRELDNRFVKNSIREVPKAKRVEEALLGAYVPVSKGELRDRLPDVSVRTIERVLGQMVRDGRIEKIGSYRDARYRRV